MPKVRVEFLILTERSKLKFLEWARNGFRQFVAASKSRVRLRSTESVSPSPARSTEPSPAIAEKSSQSLSTTTATTPAPITAAGPAFAVSELSLEEQAAIMAEGRRRAYQRLGLEIPVMRSDGSVTREQRWGGSSAIDKWATQQPIRRNGHVLSCTCADCAELFRQDVLAAVSDGGRSEKAGEGQGSGEGNAGPTETGQLLNGKDGTNG